MKGFIYLYLLHFIGDVGFTPTHVAKLKQRNPLMLIIHAFITAGLIYVFWWSNVWALIYLIFIHVIIDALKVNEVVDFYGDQYLHIISIAILYVWRLAV